MRALALPVAILLIFAAPSCKKDSSIPLEPSTIYNKKSIRKIADTRVFAVSGEIRTASVLNRFAGNDTFWLNNISAQLYPNQGTVDKLKVLTEKAVEVFEQSQYYPYNAARNGNNVTLTAADTTTAISYNEVFTRTIPYKIALYKPPVFTEKLVTSTRGYYGFEYTTLKQYHLEMVDGGIDVPWIVGVIHNANGSTNSLMVQNKTDLNFYKSLAAGDTVVIREHSVHYEQ